MQTYIYYFIIFFVIMFDAKVDSEYIMKNNKFNTSLEIISFCIVYLLSLFILYDSSIMPFNKWLIYTMVTAIILRIAFYGLFLNIFLKRGLWYSKNDKGLIHINDIRISFIAISIVWLFIHNKFI